MTFLRLPNLPLPLLRFLRPRRAPGWAILLLILGLCSCATSAQSLLLGVPYSWWRAREVGNLPRPDAAQLVNQAPGTRVLIAARLPAGAAVNAGGLALSSAQQRVTPARTPGTNSTPQSDAADWQTVEPLPLRVGLLLADQTPLLVQFASNVQLLSTQQVMPPDDPNRRYVGYLPGQALAIEGTWEGQGVVTASALYAGTPDDYGRYVAAQRGGVFALGAVCGGLGMLLLGTWAAVRLFWR